MLYWFNDVVPIEKGGVLENIVFKNRRFSD